MDFADLEARLARTLADRIGHRQVEKTEKDAAALVDTVRAWLADTPPARSPFEVIREINLQRCVRWHGEKGVKDWSVLEWAGAMTGEAGEAANAAKKLKRLYSQMQQEKGPPDLEAAIAALSQEVGDTYLYLDLLAARESIAMLRAIVDTFNRVSVREGFPERLTITETGEVVGCA